MSNTFESEGLESYHHIADVAEEILLKQITTWHENEYDPKALEDVEFITGPVTYLAEKGDHEVSSELRQKLEGVLSKLPAGELQEEINKLLNQ